MHLARRAGEIARRHREVGVTVSAKSSSTDLVTDADRAVEQFLVGELGKLRPHDAVLAEEGSDVTRQPEGSEELVCWVIDPIDGTVNYVLGQPHYAVSIAVKIGTQVVAGSVLNPVSGELFHARLGEGAFAENASLRRRPLTGPRSIALSDAVVATGFGYDRAWRGHQGRVVAELMPKVGNLRRFGSAALDLCAIASGWVDLYFECPLNEWDYAAGLLIAREAGVTVSGLRGREPGAWMVAGAHPHNAEEFFTLLTDLNADFPAAPETAVLR
jgi:myo-inositol-1(or 4)-monophosphatase